MCQFFVSSSQVHKVLNKQTHVIVKGGRNFVTVSNLRASVDDQREKTPIESSGTGGLRSKC